jgi:hypothetical protein
MLDFLDTSGIGVTVGKIHKIKQEKIIQQKLYINI